MYAYALHMGFDEQTAMDAIHDLFYKLCLREPTIDKYENLRFYLFRSPPQQVDRPPSFTAGIHVIGSK